MQFIAEIGSNHNRSIGRILTILQYAQKVGCDAVKFQYFKADKLYHEKEKETIEIVKQRELPMEYIPIISKLCKEYHLQLGVTPFDTDSIHFLNTYVDFFKIGSYELLYLPLIQKVARTGKPLIISTGMATTQEIVDAVTVCQVEKVKKLSLLYCVSNYPAYAYACNFNRIKELKEFFPNANIGYSDHTTELSMMMKAKAYGAKLFEFHVDLNDYEGYETKYGHCWDFPKVKEMIRSMYLWDSAQGLDMQKKNNRLLRMDPEDGRRPVKEARK